MVSFRRTVYEPDHLSTVGFEEVYTLSPTGKIFTMILVVMGVSGVAYTVSVIGQMVLEGELKRLLGRKRKD